MNLRKTVFRDLYQRYYQAVFFFFLGLGCDREHARDLAQETFLRVYENIEGFRGEAKAKTWVLAIAGNLWKNELRFRSAQKRSAETVSMDEMEQSGEPLRADLGRVSLPRTPHEKTQNVEWLAGLNQAIADLPPRLRQCLVLRARDGCSYQEIADLMGLSPESVKTFLYQARKQLKVQAGDLVESLQLPRKPG